jgi:2-dehydro-3-deoxygalactonokinase
MLPDFFISCDWGTSNFRLRLVETNTLCVIEEVNSSMGIKTLNDQCQNQDRLTFFTSYLQSQILLLPEEHQTELVVISGMASSNIGMKEMPYAKMPMDASGEHLSWKILNILPNSKAILVSGVKSKHSMMRGEEIQAIGIADQLPPGLLILPGTHSKHLTFKNGTFSDMKTFMTGELFELLSTKSILSNSVINSPFSEKAFFEGVAGGLKESVNASLFSVRAKHILENSHKEENFHYLSGLLIGDELSYLQNTSENISLCGSEPVFSLYKTALLSFLNPEKLFFFDDDELQKAVLKGHRKIINLALSGK